MIQSPLRLWANLLNEKTLCIEAEGDTDPRPVSVNPPG